MPVPLVVSSTGSWYTWRRRIFGLDRPSCRPASAASCSWRLPLQKLGCARQKALLASFGGSASFLPPGLLPPGDLVRFSVKGVPAALNHSRSNLKNPRRPPPNRCCKYLQVPTIGWARLLLLRFAPPGIIIPQFTFGRSALVGDLLPPKNFVFRRHFQAFGFVRSVLKKGTSSSVADVLPVQGSGRR